MNEQARRTIASYATYQEAERAVDHLSDQGFPVERVAIIGQDLRLVEQVTGRMGNGGAALHGAASGALPGALIGWIFGVLNWLNPVVSGLLLALYGLIFGALVGALLGLLVHAAQRGRRDFASVSSMQPSRYEVVADEAVADEAVRLLAALSSGTGTSTSSGASKSSVPRSGSTAT
ncbi:general stress protein [Streptomyces sp. NBC_00539]|uniref:general stress protein n=1 Tax=Streptomyces sp. NBC_00539 TaxID=2975770 RepID=UPI002E80C18F|nr:general stress protein [Streptomyces sp. NBC_00539]WUC62953.1 glycine zipper family protein [Streptomyces sp. NBC_00539]